MPEKRTANAPVPPAENAARDLLFDLLDLDVDTLADLATITGAGGEELARVFGGIRLDAPLLGARDVHGGVKGLEDGPYLQSGNSHGLLRDESPVERDSNGSYKQEQIGNAAAIEPSGSIPAPEQDSVRCR
jgi:hypothetical protein